MDSDVSVVDDSAAIRKILQRVLGQTGMAINTIHEAGDGQEALELLRSQRVNLVLTDTNMPRMDGLELLAAIRRSSEWAAVPFVMITTEGGEAKVAEAVCPGPQGTSGSLSGRSNQGETGRPLGAGSVAMNVRNLIVSSFQHSVIEVFSTMLSRDIQFEGTSMERDAPDADDRVVSFIGLDGTWSGTGTLTCSPAAACRLCSEMLLAEDSSVSEEVLDAIAEVTNMIIGHVKSSLERHLGPLGLSIPTVVFGRNFKPKARERNGIRNVFAGRANG